MAKSNPLLNALNAPKSAVVQAPLAQPVLPKAKAKAVVEPVETVEQGARKRAPSRAGKVLIAGHFAPEVQTALKIIAAQERTTVQELLTEGIDLVLAKRGKPQIASLSVQE